MMVIMLGVYDSESFMPNVLFLLMFCDFSSGAVGWSPVCNCAIFCLYFWKQCR